MTLRQRRFHRVVMIAGMILTLSAMPGHAEYRISQGEVLDITVFRVPELSRQASVDVDGRLAFPPLGLISVSGLTIAEIADEIQKELAKAEILVDAPVTVGLAAVQPVVVGGDVANPGAYPFQSGMSVRRAISLAGGIGIAREAQGEAAELRGRRDEIGADLLGRYAALAKARAARAGSDILSPQDVPPVNDNIQRQAIIDLANQLLSAELAEQMAEKQHLGRVLEIVDQRIDRLNEQAQAQQELLAKHQIEVDRYNTMLARGLTAQTRVFEEQRALQSAQENASRTQADIADVRLQKEQASHDLARFDERRNAALSTEIQSALLEIEALQARLGGIDARLAQIGILGRQPMIITLYRIENGKELAISADPSMILQPGEHIEVSLERQAITLAAPRDLAPTSP